MMNRLLLALCFATLTTLATAQQVMPLWPHGTPEPAQTKEPESMAASKNKAYPGVEMLGASNVTVPTLTLYPVPAGVTATGAAVVVYPGGEYQHLSMVLEGSMPCEWFNSLGIFCAVAKYRVPFPTHYPENFAQLEDAQQAIRIVRSHAKKWKLDPKKIGVMGFSAGGHLSVTLSQHYDDAHIASTPAAADADANVSARPDFVFLVYPAYLPVPLMNNTNKPVDIPLVLDPNLTPRPDTPPTFIVQAENDVHYIDSALAYFRALKNASIPAELHIFPDGGHGFGMHPAGVSPEHWEDLGAAWLRGLSVAAR